MKELEDSVFEGCSALKKFVVTDPKSGYKSIDVVLFYEFDDHSLNLIAYPAGKKDKEYTIPSKLQVRKAI